VLKERGERSVKTAISVMDATLCSMTAPSPPWLMVAIPSKKRCQEMKDNPDRI